MGAQMEKNPGKKRVLYMWDIGEMVIYVRYRGRWLYMVDIGVEGNIW